METQRVPEMGGTGNKLVVRSEPEEHTEALILGRGAREHTGHIYMRC